MNDCQNKLQFLLDVTEYYGQTYNVNYSDVKSKVTVVGAATDRKYFAELAPWHLDGQTVQVTEDNDHLGQIVSGVDQEMKNVDLRIKKRQKLPIFIARASFSKEVPSISSPQTSSCQDIHITNY